MTELASDNENSAKSYAITLLRLIDFPSAGGFVGDISFLSCVDPESIRVTSLMIGHLMSGGRLRFKPPREFAQNKSSAKQIDTD